MNTISFLRHWRVCLTLWMLAPMDMAQPCKALPSSQATLVELDRENCFGYWTADYKCQPVKIKGHVITPKQDWSSLVMASHAAQGVDTSQNKARTSINI
jgi:hypothetical protein